MTSRTLRLTFLSYWHAGTGRGQGADLDAVCLRTAGGLPCFPGRALKGLLREGLVLAGAEPPEIAALLGSDLRVRVEASSTGKASEEAVERALTDGRFQSTPGAIQLGSARVGLPEERAACERWGASHRSAGAAFFERLSSTAIDADGVARDKTLRSIEVALPISLHSTVTGAPDHLDRLASAFPLVRAAGAHRARGLGRCTLEYLV